MPLLMASALMGSAVPAVAEDMAAPMVILGRQEKRGEKVKRVGERWVVVAVREGQNRQVGSRCRLKML